MTTRLNVLPMPNPAWKAIREAFSIHHIPLLRSTYTTKANLDSIPEKLCKQCHAFFLAECSGPFESNFRRRYNPTHSASDWLEHKRTLHESLVGLNDSVEAKCPICSAIAHSMSHELAKDVSSKVVLETNPGGRSRRFKGLNCHLSASIISERFSRLEQVEFVLEKPDDFISNNTKRSYQRKIIEQLNAERFQKGDNATDSSYCFKLAAFWLDSCPRFHSVCQTGQTSLPSRVIYVGSTDKSSMPYLLEDKGHRGRYATLSYHWGSSEPFTTTKETLARRKAGIPMSSMPRTYQDAIIICRHLHIQYIWIDALCIIQDSPEDWEVHSARMCDIYQRSILTIAASHGEDPNRGCFVDRNGLANHAYSFERPEDGFRTSRWIMSLSENGLSNPEYKSRLSRRAWIYQEQMLSPRILYYGETGISWECADARATELNPYMLKSRGHFSKFKLSLLNPDQGCSSESEERVIGTVNTDFWHEIVREYTNREISHATDRMAAILGIAGALQESCNLRFQAGLREHAILSDLLWQVIPDSITSGEPARSDQPVGPTWSWTSVSTAVTFVDLKNAIFTAHDPRVHLEGPPSCPKGTLTISGVCRAAEYRGAKGSSRAFPLDDDGQILEELSPILIYGDEIIPLGSKVWLLEIAQIRNVDKRIGVPNRAWLERSSLKEIFYLVLAEVSGAPRPTVFRRIGMAKLPHEVSIAVSKNATWEGQQLQGTFEII